VKVELLTLPEHMCPPTVLNGIHVAEYLVFSVIFCRSCLSLSFFLCFDCPSIYGFRLSTLWYLQIILVYSLFIAKDFVKINLEQNCKEPIGTRLYQHDGHLFEL